MVKFLNIINFKSQLFASVVFFANLMNGFSAVPLQESYYISMFLLLDTTIAIFVMLWLDQDVTFSKGDENEECDHSQNMTKSLKSVVPSFMTSFSSQESLIGARLTASFFHGSKSYYQDYDPNKWRQKYANRSLVSDGWLFNR